jgi:predicted ATPase
MITSISLENFKAFRSAEIPLERFTVIVGPNASGKTSILEALDSLLQLALPTTKPSQFLVGPRHPKTLCHRHSPGRTTLSARRQTSRGELRYRVSLICDKTEQNPDDWDLLMGAELGAEKKSVEGKQYSSKDLPKEFRNLGSAVFLRLDARALAEPCYDEPEPHLGYHGEGLSTALSELALNKPDEFHQVQENLRSIVPVVSRVRFRRVSVSKTEIEQVQVGQSYEFRPVTRSHSGQEILFDTLSANDVPASAVSEGTLMVLGLLTALVGPRDIRLLLLDDLDRGLHPKAQKELVELLRRMLKSDPELQIAATSHSPYLLDNMQAAEIRITALAPDGSARCARLTDHPEFEKWKEQMLPGELWSTFGEKWIENLPVPTK